MKAYSIFDDFECSAIQTLVDSGVDLVVHPSGIPRPTDEQMKIILEEYDCVIIGTSQKITQKMFDNITSPRIIATASVGTDHINIPNEKKTMVTVINTPKANARSVAEYTIAMALSCCKRLGEGNDLYRRGKSNKELYQKPEDLYGKTIGVIGAGYISATIMEYAASLGMKVIFWTKNPNKHRDLEKKGFCYVDLQELIATSDVLSVNLPNTVQTKSIINKSIVDSMKNDCIFISVSRLDVVDMDALLEKAVNNRSFYVCVDIDVDSSVVNKINNSPNVFVTPHIAGGTIETRKRMFRELANEITKRCKK